VPASSRARREASPLLTISFPVNHRALAYLLGQWTALRPATQRAVLEAGDRGCITNAYYFIDVDTSIAREMRDCFRRRADKRGMEGRLCRMAASSISDRLHVAWYSAPCPVCGHRIRPPHLVRDPGRFVVSCAYCRWPAPD